jgi:hypothetical protein
MMSNWTPALSSTWYIMRATCMARREQGGDQGSGPGAWRARESAWGLGLGRWCAGPGHVCSGSLPGLLLAAGCALAHLVQDIWVGDDHAQVHVDRGQQAALELELAELDGLRWGRLVVFRRQRSRFFRSQAAEGPRAAAPRWRQARSMGGAGGAHLDLVQRKDQLLDLRLCEGLVLRSDRSTVRALLHAGRGLSGVGDARCRPSPRCRGCRALSEPLLLRAATSPPQTARRAGCGRLLVLRGRRQMCWAQRPC